MYSPLLAPALATRSPFIESNCATALRDSVITLGTILRPRANRRNLLVTRQTFQARTSGWWTGASLRASDVGIGDSTPVHPGRHLILLPMNRRNSSELTNHRSYTRVSSDIDIYYKRSSTRNSLGIAVGESRFTITTRRPIRNARPVSIS